MKTSVTESPTSLKKTPLQVLLFEFAKFLRTPILKNICERLFLYIKQTKHKQNSMLTTVMTSQ